MSSMSYMTFFIPHWVIAKVINPAILKTANVTVAGLPQSKINSLIRRPRVPMMSKIKPLNLTNSLIDILPGPNCLIGGYRY